MKKKTTLSINERDKSRPPFFNLNIDGEIIACTQITGNSYLILLSIQVSGEVLSTCSESFAAPLSDSRFSIAFRTSDRSILSETGAILVSALSFLPSILSETGFSLNSNVSKESPDSFVSSSVDTCNWDLPWISEIKKER